MKANTVNFERNQDPKKAMDIGMTPERILDKFGEQLEKFGIEIEYAKSQEYKYGAYDIVVIGTDEFADENYHISYITDELAKDEFDDVGGFMIADDMGREEIDHDDISQDPSTVIKKMLEIKYGDLPSIKAKKIIIKRQLEELNEIEKYLTKG